MTLFHFVTASSRRLPEIRDTPRLTAQLENMHAGVRPVDGIDIASTVDLHIIRLDRDLAALTRGRLDAALIGFRRDRGDIVADLFRPIGIADIHRSHARIEPGKDPDPYAVRRMVIFV